MLQHITEYHTLWLFNIAMDNVQFIDDFPIKTAIYSGFSMAMLNNQMVDINYKPTLHVRKLDQRSHRCHLMFCQRSHRGAASSWKNHAIVGIDDLLAYSNHCQLENNGCNC